MEREKRIEGILTHFERQYLMLFMKLYAFAKYTGITFVDSTMIPVCHNERRYFNKLFSGLVKSGNGTMG